MATHAAARGSAASDSELEAELRQAEQDFSSGDYVVVTVEEVDDAVAAGEWPWPHAFSA